MKRKPWDMLATPDHCINVMIGEQPVSIIDHDAAKLISQAGIVKEKTGKTPVDLMNENVRLMSENIDLVDALERIVKWGNDRNFSEDCESGKMLIQARQALKKVRSET